MQFYGKNILNTHVIAIGVPTYYSMSVPIIILFLIARVIDLVDGGRLLPNENRVVPRNAYPKFNNTIFTSSMSIVNALTCIMTV